MLDREFLEATLGPLPRGVLKRDLAAAMKRTPADYSRLLEVLKMIYQRDPRLLALGRRLGVSRVFVDDDVVPNVRAALSQATAAGPYTMHPLDPAMLRDLFPPRRRGAHKRRAW